MITPRDLRPILHNLTHRLENLETQEATAAASYEDVLAAPYTLTSALASVPGWTFDLEAGTYLVAISATTDPTLDSGDNGERAEIVLRGNGVDQAGSIVTPLFYDPASPDLRTQLTSSWIWRYTVPAGETHTMEVRARKTGGGGSSEILQGTMVAIRP